MASVIFHAYNQINATGKVKLFRSHRSDYKDGMQLRDFIYVKDVFSVCLHFLNNQNHSGIYNLGTGKARSFIDLANAVFSALNRYSKIEFIDIPQDIRDKYQYFTEAKMEKLLKTGYTKEFTSLENGVGNYVKNYLTGKRYL
jgi:ADP-L-glycero-D-manno-heptose 6-epimerase